MFSKYETMGDRTTVAGEGPPDARIMLIGQNPGAEEEKQGKPFIGRAGRFLDGVLKKYGLRREEIYITSVVKFKTPGNRKPTAQEIHEGMPSLIEEILKIRPLIVVLMGQVAWQVPKLQGIRYIETYHPAAAMRFPEARKRFDDDFRKLTELNDQVDFSGH